MLNNVNESKYYLLLKTILKNQHGILEWNSNLYLNNKNQLLPIEPLVIKIINELQELELYYKS